MTHEFTIQLAHPLRAARLAGPTSDLVELAPHPLGVPPAAQHPQLSQPDSDQRARWQAESEALERGLAGITAATQELLERRLELIGEMQQVAVELAVAVAGRLMHEKIQASDYPIESIVRESVRHLETTQPVRVRLHPDDLVLFTRRLGEKSLVAGGGAIQFEADANLARGECHAETDEVSVISQWKTQLEELRRHLLGSLKDAEIERRKAQPGDRSLRRFPDRRQTA